MHLVHERRLASILGNFFAQGLKKVRSRSIPPDESEVPNECLFEPSCTTNLPRFLEMNWAHCRFPAVRSPVLYHQGCGSLLKAPVFYLTSASTPHNRCSPPLVFEEFHKVRQTITGHRDISGDLSIRDRALRRFGVEGSLIISSTITASWELWWVSSGLTSAERSGPR